MVRDFLNGLEFLSWQMNLLYKRTRYFTRTLLRNGGSRAISRHQLKRLKKIRQRHSQVYMVSTLLIVVDEASGVPDPVFIPLEGAMTQEDNMVILIGNPTKNTGYFHETQFDPKLSKSWTHLHWDSRKSTNVTKEMIEYFRISMERTVMYSESELQENLLLMMKILTFLCPGLFSVSGIHRG